MKKLAGKAAGSSPGTEQRHADEIPGPAERHSSPSNGRTPVDPADDPARSRPGRGRPGAVVTRRQVVSGLAVALVVALAGALAGWFVAAGTPGKRTFDAVVEAPWAPPYGDQQQLTQDTDVRRALVAVQDPAAVRGLDVQVAAQQEGTSGLVQISIVVPGDQRQSARVAYQRILDHLSQTQVRYLQARLAAAEPVPEAADEVGKLNVALAQAKDGASEVQGLTEQDPPMATPQTLAAAVGFVLGGLAGLVVARLTVMKPRR